MTCCIFIRSSFSSDVRWEKPFVTCALICNVKFIGVSVAASAGKLFVKYCDFLYVPVKRDSSTNRWHKPRCRKDRVATFDRGICCFSLPDSHELASINPVSFSRQQRCCFCAKYRYQIEIVDVEILKRDWSTNSMIEKVSLSLFHVNIRC